MDQAKRSNKKEVILTAAARIFGEKGFYEATIEEIAIEAGVGKGTVYEYFPSKLVLFKEMHNHFANAYMSSYDRLNELDTYAERLWWVFISHLRFSIKHADFARVMFINPASISEELQIFIMENRQDKLSRLKALIEGGIAAGEFRAVNVDLAIEMATAYLGTLMCLAVFHEQIPISLPMPSSDEEIESTAQKALDLFLNGISKVN